VVQQAEPQLLEALDITASIRHAELPMIPDLRRIELEVA
jgi:hypothetical protein